MGGNLNEIEPSKIDRIMQLHAEIVGAVRMSIGKAIEIGELLETEKAKISHGEWSKWVGGNLPFDIRTAQRYMKANANRDRIKYDSVSLLTEAYEAIEKPKTRNRVEDLQRRQHDAHERARKAAEEELALMAELGKYSQDVDTLDALHEQNNELQREGGEIERVLEERLVSLFWRDGDGELDDWERLKAEARSRGLTTSALLRMVVHEWLP